MSSNPILTLVNNSNTGGNNENYLYLDYDGAGSLINT